MNRRYYQVIGYIRRHHIVPVELKRDGFLLASVQLALDRYGVPVHVADRQNRQFDPGLFTFRPGSLDFAPLRFRCGRCRALGYLGRVAASKKSHIQTG